MTKCILCMSENNIIKEHAIPKCLFPKNERKNLITVPTCGDCNNSLSSDEESFREFMLNCAGNDSEASKSLINSESFRSMEKAPGKAFNLLSKMEAVNFNGKEMAILDWTVVDQEKHIRSINKIVKSLYFHHFNKILPTEISIENHLRFLNTQSPEDFFKCRFNYNETYKDICRYGYAMTPNSFSGVWVLTFYNKVVFWNILIDSLSKEIGTKSEIVA